MEGFKSTPKMQCFKEGGSVQRKIENFTKRDRKVVDEADIKQDKAIVKKAISMHDKQEHKGEHTDLSKLRKGGRAKKCGGGTVSRYKAGGSVTNVYEAKKSSGDIDNIAKVKDIKPAKAAAPSKAATKPNFKGSDVEKEKSKPSADAVSIIKSKQSGKAAAAPSGAKGPDLFKKGGKVKKYAMGGDVMSATDAKLAALEKQRQMEKMKRARALPPSMQSQLISQSPAAAGLTSPAMAGMPASTASAAAMPPTDQMGMPTQKRGGKVKRKC
jgi:hypothetical protein